MILALLTASTISSVDLPETAYGRIAEDSTIEVATERNTEEIVREYFKDIPIMAEVSRCESRFNHYSEDGSVLKGRVDSDDTGVMQINKRYHEATAVSMNLDLDNLYDNLAYARSLYERQGTQPWSASMPCWDKSLALNY